MIVGAYSLHLYCDYPDDAYKHRGGERVSGAGMGEFAGDNNREAMAAARSAGWVFNKRGQCLCPSCARAGRELGENDFF